MTRTKFNLRPMVKTVAILAAVTMFAACEPEEENNPTDPGTEQDANFVAFTFEGIDGWAVAYKEYEYPLGEFAAYVSTRKSGGGFLGYGHTLWDIAGDTDTYEMPDNTEVTEFYVRSEKVMDILCDVYQAHDRTYDDDLTWWVDPATGLTLKYERKTADGDTESYEVTKLTVGKPEWDKLHLHPIDGDTFVNVD